MITSIIILYLISSVLSSGEKNPAIRRAYDYDLYESVLDPALCQKHLQEMNTFEFYDASFRVPQGMLKGNTFSLGNYEQCLEIDQPLDEGSIPGKYCLIETESLHIPVLTGASWLANTTWTEVDNIWTGQYLEIYKQERRKLSVLKDESRDTVTDMINAVPLTLALCIPRACAVDDVLAPLLDSPHLEFHYAVEFCRLPGDKLRSGADIAFIVVFSLIGCCILISTAYELHHIFVKKDTTKPDELWSSFSVYGNTDRLLTLGSKPGALDCLDGIRSLSILWVIFGHSIAVHFGLYLSNILDFFMWSLKVRSVILMGADVSVDSFFVLSGLLLVYTTANKMKQMDLVKNVHLFYLNRLLRMFPLLAATILLQASVMHHVTDGMRWDRVARDTQQCRDYWWSALLHIQNIVNPMEYCLRHAWYLAVDVQLHILSPLLLVWVLGSRRVAYSSLIAALLAFVSGATIFCFIMKFPPYTNYEYEVYFHKNPLTRAPVFIIGMLCGYILHLWRGKNMKISPPLVISGYALAMMLAAYCMYHVHPDWESQTVINLNRALMRSGWAAALCWLIVACVHGYAGPINWFLSMKLWKFIARISYAMYLLHFPMQFVTRGADSAPIYFSMEKVFVYFASDVAYAVVVSTAACVLVDAPVSTLIRIIMKAIMPKSSSPQPKSKDVQEFQSPENKNEEAKNGNKVA